MKQMEERDIVTYLKNNIEPLEDKLLGEGYRASVHLVDGLLLPCVVFRNPTKTIELAIRRFREEQSGRGISRSKNGYKEIVEHFITRGNRINVYDIASIKESDFAFPVSILKQIRGETIMSWTGFAAKMKDGKHFGFGTAYGCTFFHMPDGYSAKDIDEIVNHSYVLKTGELSPHKITYANFSDVYKDTIVYRERPFFECYIDGL